MYRARDHAITGIGIDMSPLFTAQATRRAEELGVSERVHFIHNDAAGYVANEKCDVAACVGATGLRGRSRDDGSAGKKPQAQENNAHRRTVLASGTRDGRDSSGLRHLVDCRLSLCPVWLRLSINRAMTVEMVLADQKAGTGTKPQNG